MLYQINEYGGHFGLALILEKIIANLIIFYYRKNQYEKSCETSFQVVEWGDVKVPNQKTFYSKILKTNIGKFR